MYRFFLTLPLFFVLSFSWSCGVCKTREQCRNTDIDSDARTEIELTVPLSRDIKVGEASPFRIVFSANGQKQECIINEQIHLCSGPFSFKQIHFSRASNGFEQRISILMLFFQKELGFFVEHDGVVLFDDTIDFEKKPNFWHGYVAVHNCQTCVHRGYAFLTSPITD